jgi:hypothetical protein
MDKELEELIWRRAAGRCEYRQFPHPLAELPFEVDHIVARKHRGETVQENLSLGGLGTCWPDRNRPNNDRCLANQSPGRGRRSRLPD